MSNESNKYADRAADKALLKPVSMRSMTSGLRALGFYVGLRDPDRNSDYSGRWMVAESLEVGPTKDASTGGFCVVGDDLRRLLIDAYSHAFTAGLPPRR